MHTPYLLLLLLLPLCGCGGKGGDRKGHINLIEKEALQPRDAKTQGYYDSRYYLPNVVRLNKGQKNAFIYIDSLRYKPAGLLDKTNREEYYSKAIANVSPNELQVHRAIWAMPEVQKLQMADGGYSTVVTYITATPKTTGHYIVELRRNNIEEMTPEKDISSFRVKLNPLVIEVANESGYYVPLKAWRAGRK